MPANRFMTVIGLALLAGLFQVANAAAPESLEATIRKLQDRQDIEHLLLEYGRSLDDRDFETYSKLFAREGEWKGALGSFKGPAAIRTAMEKIFADAAADIPRGKNFHVMSNFDIRIDGERATARSVFIFYRMNGNAPEAAVAGRYEDILVKENGVWRFLLRNALPPG